MSDDERKSVRFYAQHVERRQLANRPLSQVTCTLIGDLEEGIDFEVILRKLQKGWEVFEGDGILHDAVEVLKVDVEKEKLRYQDLEREKASMKAEFEQKLSLQEAELERLRRLERELEQLSGLAVRKVVP